MKKSDEEAAREALQNPVIAETIWLIAQMPRWKQRQMVAYVMYLYWRQRIKRFLDSPKTQTVMILIVLALAVWTLLK